ncbi:sugar transferase [Sphingomonas sp. GCM10030256]|uniref:sugar transferase n=1 Tax=Sphingomonas sp. GCM10030256 TaxID=3273427 RepID=UPI003612DDD1
MVRRRAALLSLPPRREAGLSGWAQVNQGHVAEVEDVRRKLQFDFYYIKHFSPWLDLLIL